jgi:hypothetical protein
MRSWKKPLLVGACALAAAAVLALPAWALSSVWLDEGKELKAKTTFSLAGTEFVEIGSSVMLCNVDATMTTEGGSTAQITAHTTKAEECIGLAGKLEGCKVTAASTKNLPWSVAVNTVDLTAKEVAVSYTLNEACEIDKIEIPIPSLTVVPEEQEAIRLFHFKHIGKGTVDGKETELTYSGTLNLPPEDWDRYGIG